MALPYSIVKPHKETFDIAGGICYDRKWKKSFCLFGKEPLFGWSKYKYQKGVNFHCKGKGDVS